MTEIIHVISYNAHKQKLKLDGKEEEIKKRGLAGVIE